MTERPPTARAMLQQDNNWVWSDIREDPTTTAVLFAVLCTISDQLDTLIKQTAAP